MVRAVIPTAPQRTFAMAALLALLSAAAYGTGDFFGGLASRRSPVSGVVLRAHAVGLALLVVVAPFAGGVLTAGDAVIGAAAGVSGGLAVALFYQGLARGTMSVVAPITALLGTAVPVLYGLVRGERPSAVAGAGIVLALLAIALVSAEDDDEGRRGIRDRAVIGLALASGAGFGVFFVVLAEAGDDAGLWPVLVARLASVALFALLVRSRFTATRPLGAGTWRLAVLAGVLDVAANTAYVFATREGLLSVVAVLTSLYPAGTVVLARLFLAERLCPPQRVGLGLAAVAAVMVAAA